MSPVPLIYRWLALLALAGALLAFGWVKGAGHVQARWDAATTKDSLRVAVVKQKQAEATVQVVTKYVDRVRTVHVVGEAIIKEVPVYVPSDTPDLPGGFRLLHDAATVGEPPDPARVADASPVPTQDVAATVAENYLICRATAEQLTSLQEWVSRQSGLSSGYSAAPD